MSEEKKTRPARFGAELSSLSSSLPYDMRHTPAPWPVERVPISSRGGSNSCYLIGPFHACIYDDWKRREIGISEEENQANAYLIAASPILADALVALLDRFDGIPLFPEDRAAIILAHKALDAAQIRRK